MTIILTWRSLVASFTFSSNAVVVTTNFDSLFSSCPLISSISWIRKGKQDCDLQTWSVSRVQGCHSHSCLWSTQHDNCILWHVGKYHPHHIIGLSSKFQQAMSKGFGEWPGFREGVLISPDSINLITERIYSKVLITHTLSYQCSFSSPLLFSAPAHLMECQVWQMKIHDFTLHNLAPWGWHPGGRRL